MKGSGVNPVGEGQKSLSLHAPLPHLGRPGYRGVGESFRYSGFPLVSAHRDLGPSQGPCIGETLFPGRGCITAWGLQVCSDRGQLGISAQDSPGGWLWPGCSPGRSPASPHWSLVSGASYLLVSSCSFHDKLLGDKKAGHNWKGCLKGAKGTALS